LAIPADILMVIMKTLSNNKGVALIILVITMTLIAVLGASFVSLMGSKQKGFLYQIDSYRALNIANAGLEFAIRTVYDHIDSPEMSIERCSSSWTTYDFANGQFRFCYVSEFADSNFNSVRVEGRYDGGDPSHTHIISTRQVKLVNFMNYASNSSVSRIPYNGPIVPASGNRLIIPFINSSGVAITITAIRLTAVFSSGQRHVQQIYVTDNIALPTQTHFFNYGGSLGPPLSNPCSSSPTPCNDTPSAPGIRLGSTEATLFPSNILISYPVGPNLVRWCIIDFIESPLPGSYVIEYFSGATLLGSISF
jgi:hypothetical protein